MSRIMQQRALQEHNSLRSCEEVRPQAGVGKLKHAPPLRVNKLQGWGTL